MKKMPEITDILKKLDLPQEGSYDNGFYVINLADSDEYAKIYSLLDEKANNQEYPQFVTNEQKSTTKIMHYFTVEQKNTTFNIFLIANFQQDEYYLKIKKDDLNLAVGDDI